MKIIFVTYDLPYPLTSGGKIRAYYLLKGLCQDYEVSLFSYYRDESQKQYVSKLKQELGLKEIRLYKRRWVWDPRNLVRALFSSLPLLSISYLNSGLKKDLLDARRTTQGAIFHFEAFGSSVYLVDTWKTFVRRQAPGVLRPAIFLGNENIEWQIYDKIADKRKAIFPLWLLMKYDVWKMRRFEHKLYKLADVNLGVSEGDCDYVRKITGKECFLIRNGVDLERLRRISKSKSISNSTSTSKSNSNTNSKEIIRKIAFGGDLIYQQNNEGLRWFLEEVLPCFPANGQRPTANILLSIVSLTKPKWLQGFVSVFRNTVTNVEIFSSPEIFAPNVYAKADVFIAPIRVRGGVQIKILEAMVVKTPVVTTSACAKAIGAKDGMHLLVADNPKDFAEAIVKLLSDEALSDKIKENAYQFVAKNYSWQRQADTLREIYQDRIVSSHRHLSSDQ